MVGTHYPFTHFMLVYVFPFAAWVLVVELGLQDKYEAGPDMSFGQVGLVGPRTFVSMLIFVIDSSHRRRRPAGGVRSENAPTLWSMVL
jgi:hypothetical protein